VDELPPEPELPSTPKSSLLITRINRNIEKWLKYGGIIYIVIGVLYDITNFIFKTFRAQNGFPNSDQGLIILYIISLCNTVLSTILWGFFYFGLGKIIEILRKGFQHEEE
jgi:phosphotransferase system  glucose/maltose/N-acetylglucosamine-specific IIC component